MVLFPLHEMTLLGTLRLGSLLIWLGFLFNCILEPLQSGCDYIVIDIIINHLIFQFACDGRLKRGTMLFHAFIVIYTYKEAWLLMLSMDKVSKDNLYV